MIKISKQLNFAQKFKAVMSAILPKFEDASAIDILECIYNNKLSSLYPNLDKALRIFLTLPVSIAT